MFNECVIIVKILAVSQAQLVFERQPHEVDSGL